MDMTTRHVFSELPFKFGDFSSSQCPDSVEQTVPQEDTDVDSQVFNCSLFHLDATIRREDAAVKVAKARRNLARCHRDGFAATLEINEAMAEHYAAEKESIAVEHWSPDLEQSFSVDMSTLRQKHSQDLLKLQHAEAELKLSKTQLDLHEAFAEVYRSLLKASQARQIVHLDKSSDHDAMEQVLQSLQANHKLDSQYSEYHAKIKKTFDDIPKMKTFDRLRETEQRILENLVQVKSSIPRLWGLSDVLKAKADRIKSQMRQSINENSQWLDPAMGSLEVQDVVYQAHLVEVDANYNVAVLKRSLLEAQAIADEVSLERIKLTLNVSRPPQLEWSSGSLALGI